MNAELKTKWLEALRSGKYEQGKHYLKEGGKYCCLGVLCEVAGLESELNSVFDTSKMRFFAKPVQECDRMDSDICYLPSFEERSGVTRKVQSELAEMNDEQGATFEEIAERIEKTL